VPPEALKTQTTVIGIAGMTCDHCVRTVDRALRSLPGVKDVTVDRTGALAKVVYDSSVVDVPAMQDALLKSGYTPVAG
jgi:copper chaperone CopZ